MTFILPKIYPITDVSISGLSHLEQVRRLVNGGAEFIQLREKHASPKEFYEAAKAVIDFTNGSEVKIIINDRVDIAKVVKADGVHLGQDDLPPRFARQILGDKAIIGFSTHSVSQAIEAVNEPIDYIAIGPITITTTKENPDPIVGINGLREVRNAIGGFPLVAIGGISMENSRLIRQAGADSLAIIGNILHDPNKISESYANLVKH